MPHHEIEFREYLLLVRAMTPAGIDTYVSRLGAFERQGIVQSINESTLNCVTQLEHYLAQRRVGYTDSDLRVAGTAYIEFISYFIPNRLLDGDLPVETEIEKEVLKYLVEYREGQAKFRNALLSRFNQRCCVTGCDIKELLTASHIKPFRECEKNEKYDLDNGLLLISNLDKLFDKYLISFDSDLNILISDRITQEQRLDLGLLSLHIEAELTNGCLEYLKAHQIQFQLQETSNIQLN